MSAQGQIRLISLIYVLFLTECLIHAVKIWLSQW